MIRVVVDTNILVSAFFWEGPPSKLLQAAKDEQVQLISSEILVAELQEVLSRSKFARNYQATGKTAAGLIANFRALVEIVEPDAIERTSVDPDDDVVLACAVSGKADFIISGDGDLLRLKAYKDIPIWEVGHFMDNLGKPSTEQEQRSNH